MSSSGTKRKSPPKGENRFRNPQYRQIALDVSKRYFATLPRELPVEKHVDNEEEEEEEEDVISVASDHEFKVLE